MAKHTHNRLSAKEVERLKKPGRHADGGGLYLAIDDAGRRRWVFMYVRRGKRVELGLGGGQALALSEARTQAITLREMLKNGEDPKAVRISAARATKSESKEVPTFGECADTYVETMKPSWRNPKHLEQWRMTLTVYAKPIRTLRVDEVTTQDVLDILQPVWVRIPETAKRFRGRIENVLDAAKAKGYRSGENPARWKGHLDQLLPKRSRRIRKHRPALPYEEIGEFMVELRHRPAVAARALELAILTAARTNEVLRATWDEIDLVKQVWTIPAERMKMAKEHRIPLTAPCLAILEKVKTGHKKWVFPGPRTDGTLSLMSMLMLLRRMEREVVTVHGFRSTFRDWASECTNFSREVCEMALAHAIEDEAEAAYRRGDLFQKRRKLMEAWAGYCAAPKSSKVVPLFKSRPAKEDQQQVAS